MRRLIAGVVRPGGGVEIDARADEYLAAFPSASAAVAAALAIELGFAGIAFPAEGTVALATEAGRKPRFHEACCGVPWLFDGGAR